MLEKKVVGFLENKKNTLCFKLRRAGAGQKKKQVVFKILIISFLKNKKSKIPENPDHKTREIR